MRLLQPHPSHILYISSFQTTSTEITTIHTPAIQLYPLPHQLKNPQIQRNPLPQPCRPLRMVSFFFRFHRVRVDQSAQRPAVDDQPRHERPELRRREHIHLEHGHRVRADRSVEEAVDAQLGDCMFRSAHGGSDGVGSSWLERGILSSRWRCTCLLDLTRPRLDSTREKKTTAYIRV